MSAGFFGLIADSLTRLSPQYVAARHAQIGQRASDQQAMEVFIQPAVAQLGKAEHPLDDADRVFDAGPHFGLGAVFRPLALVDDAAVAIAAIGEISRPGRALPDHCALATVGLITPHPGLSAKQIGGVTHVGVWKIAKAAGIEFTTGKAARDLRPNKESR